MHSKSHPSHKLWRVMLFAQFWFSRALNTCLPLFIQNTYLQLYNQMSIKIPFNCKANLPSSNGKQWQQH